MAERAALAANRGLATTVVVTLAIGVVMFTTSFGVIHAGLRRRT